MLHDLLFAALLAQDRCFGDAPASRSRSGRLWRRIYAGCVVTIDEVRAVASVLPRSSEGLVRGQVKFRIGRIVYLALSKDGSTMGFAFPKELRAALVESEPEKFALPSASDLRYHWVHVRLAAIDADEMRDLVDRHHGRSARRI